MEELFCDMALENTKLKNNKCNNITPQLVLYGTPSNKLFVSYYKNFILEECANKYFDLFEKLLVYNPPEDSKVKIRGKEHEIPRKQVAYGEPNTYYNFSGIHVDAICWNENNDICNALYELRCKVNKYFGINFNFVLINRYADGKDYIGYHADDEKDLQGDSPIIGLTFGANRDFQLKHKKTGEKMSLVLHHGSCVAMHYPTNKYWKHGVPKRAGIKTPRINLTFRIMNV
jgi:alkylated DNA repair dioxygenase AlkB